VVGRDVVDVNTDAIIEWSPDALECLTPRILSEWDAVLDRPSRFLAGPPRPESGEA
jgi:hypothetical protein